MAESRTENQKPMGSAVVEKYEEHARTPHGRLRHDLLYMFYDEFINGRDIDWVFDIGAGSGFLVKKLIEKYPKLNAVIMDADEAMIDKAKDNLSSYLKSPKLNIIKGAVDDFPNIFRSFKIKTNSILTSFNHTIEYVQDQRAALETIRNSIPKGSFFGIMYLNNSHEAMRKLLFNDSIDKLLTQLDSPKLDLVYFGLGQAVNAQEMEKYFVMQGSHLLVEYGIRCIADLKSREFVERNYKEMLEMEYFLGKLHDFIGLARYRLKFFSI